MKKTLFLILITFISCNEHPLFKAAKDAKKYLNKNFTINITDIQLSKSKNEMYISYSGSITNNSDNVIDNSVILTDLNIKTPSNTVYLDLGKEIIQSEYATDKWKPNQTKRFNIKKKLSNDSDFNIDLLDYNCEKVELRVRFQAKNKVDFDTKKVYSYDVIYENDNLIEKWNSLK